MGFTSHVCSRYDAELLDARSLSYRDGESKATFFLQALLLDEFGYNDLVALRAMFKTELGRQPEYTIPPFNEETYKTHRVIKETTLYPNLCTRGTKVSNEAKIDEYMNRPAVVYELLASILDLLVGRWMMNPAQNGNDIANARYEIHEYVWSTPEGCPVYTQLKAIAEPSGKLKDSII